MSQKRVQLMEGDCLDRLRCLEDASVDSVVTDPPYGLAFMGKSWDKSLPGIEHYQECLRVLKPGRHLLAFGGSRTYHRTACAIEDAGFEIRDCIMWIYGSGFPKSLDVAKAIDKEAGHWRGKAGAVRNGNQAMSGPNYERTDKGEPITAAAAAASGWGTALKPAHEPIVMARKPIGGTVASNFRAHGTGALNIDGCRVGFADDKDMESAAAAQRSCRDQNKNRVAYGSFDNGEESLGPYLDGLSKGRYPTNVIHDGSACVVEAMPARTPRFFYCAKASKAEREAGVAGVNNHPTVKPVALMRYLCRLVTPPDGVTLDPFMGSGTTGVAAVLEGFRFVGIEREAEYCAIARQRIRAATELLLSR